ncbi:LysM peptidoglycan-binding domain-containing protein [Cellulomonas soli]|uniref:lytic transglycosylase n=1 Tax=Cellulomonas soli TaxID=931535 RepID=UPI003F83B970
MTQPATARSARLRRAGTGTGATLALAAVAVTATGGAAHADERYTVRSGDTVSHIATRTGSTVTAISRANNLADASRIRIGQVLTIPSATTTTATTAAAPAAASTAAAPAAGTHAVRSGETVSAIAKRYGTSVQAVVAANGLDARAFIRAGQVLTIPGTATSTGTASVTTAAAPSAATTSATHTVVAGDTAGAIAKRYGTSVQAIITANGLNSRALIRIGQTLSIPGATAGTTPTTTAPTTQLVGNTFEGRTYPATVVASANANKATLLTVGVPTKAEMRTLVADTARTMGVDPALALAVAFQESGFNHASVSPANAIGTMQVIPSSGEWASQLVGRQLNLLDPTDNVVAGVAILRSLIKTSPDLPTAIAGYYQGASSVRRHGMFADTRRYVANVQTHMTRFA